jgi:hypothetical protein
MDYVKDIRSDEIIVQCESPALRKELELPGTLVGSVAVVPFRDRSELWTCPSSTEDLAGPQHPSFNRCGKTV